MRIAIYQVDAFADEVFRGNPAAVCPLQEWPDDRMLSKIAGENNLSETAFYVVKGDRVEIRWFTPAVEVDLCGHATLATAYVLKKYESFPGTTIPFYSHRSGELPVTVQGDQFTLNFPADQFSEVPLTPELLAATDKQPVAAYRSKARTMLIFDNQEDVEHLKPNLSVIADLETGGLIVTAKAEKYDFVSRYFAPAKGVNEDPVTGSAHTTLVPYWADQLQKQAFSAFQTSERGGKVGCRLLGDRVELTGSAILYLKGEIYI
ncbi:PhzF family phenazine biosynthesis protein [Dyadobacter sp. BE34]|uniref:PhzF family phenazine biosynthesis protein n=1 Tax=Dyadobacter fermentans TaxID=94254 RepID=A0ABU1R0C4_9BACT|nr:MULTISPECIES: PhzF family phenazine biosynthesis protein [Dyadobacter]MDR6806862.1 PhzF family phenazine biosynthesis protein [Dyadobacter fermentans]MDR7044604.1 PhzF family phenazine biosynthesis protein [Dyadobacter sp. BE242]MDR7198914.1 PhzF family phenazine biosynthesis protein [Dyadobacter sp. BE34]MDR7216876.1 PhzF family phenazine biosynthesis protein [Dyadobacter sp. BE31]MDR7263598.1 PhzF family phenazine biosynthesis protein [Dyadobacter sp. BE32]